MYWEDEEDRTNGWLWGLRAKGEGRGVGNEGRKEAGRHVNRSIEGQSFRNDGTKTCWEYQAYVVI